MVAPLASGERQPPDDTLSVKLPGATPTALRGRADLPKFALAALPLTLAQQQPLLYRLDGQTRAKVIAALAGLIILGFALVLLTWFGARVTRRYMRGPQRYQPSKPLPPPDDWAQP